YFGVTVSEIERGGEAYEIDVRLAPEDRNALSDLDDFNITMQGGKLVPLSAIANVKNGRGYARIIRVDGARTVTVQGDVDKRVANANAIIADMKKSFFPGFKTRHPRVILDIEGQDKNAGKTQKSMVKGFAVGLIGVFLLLSFQFRSYVEPIVVMIVIPFAFIGVVWGHLAMGLEFTMPSMLGFVALAGIVVNDSILLVEFLKEHHEPGGTVAEAAPKAAKARFRAILLTSLTTIAGLIPILSETSLQAQILIPLVTSLAFGLLASTLLVLFVVPAIYAILDDFGVSTLARERRKLGSGPAAEPE
ncbi:MAG TPA: efflux RND transporter permease subunit, partial [Rhizobiales bacterium]|nr:efflux RND transporter permease subunit [Hyphomicrobiales bacterium]